MTGASPTTEKVIGTSEGSGGSSVVEGAWQATTGTRHTMSADLIAHELGFTG
jgi:hypothetical protein